MRPGGRLFTGSGRLKWELSHRFPKILPCLGIQDRGHGSRIDVAAA